MSDNEDVMMKISELISSLQAVKDQFGDTCVYIRRGGLSWGAVALNRRDDDRKHGVFDLQAQHDRDMIRRLEQIERLKASRIAAEMKLNEVMAAASTSDAIREEMAAAFVAGATAVHNTWRRCHELGEGPCRGDPEFEEAANDYAAIRATKSKGAGTGGGE